jgi:hypothetical protein
MPLAVVAGRGERAALHLLGGSGDAATVLVLHANGFGALM